MRKNGKSTHAAMTTANESGIVWPGAPTERDGKWFWREPVFGEDVGPFGTHDEAEANFKSWEAAAFDIISPGALMDWYARNLPEKDTTQ